MDKQERMEKFQDLDQELFIRLQNFHKDITSMQKAKFDEIHLSKSIQEIKSILLQFEGIPQQAMLSSTIVKNLEKNLSHVRRQHMKSKEKELTFFKQKSKHILKESKTVMMDDYKLEFLSLSNFNENKITNKKEDSLFKPRSKMAQHNSKSSNEESADDCDNGLRNQIQKLIQEKNFLVTRHESELLQKNNEIFELRSLLQTQTNDTSKEKEFLDLEINSQKTQNKDEHSIAQKYNSQMKKAIKRINNLERQLRNRNKDYLFALKELEKNKIKAPPTSNEDFSTSNFNFLK